MNNFSPNGHRNQTTTSQGRVQTTANSSNYNQARAEGNGTTLQNKWVRLMQGQASPPSEPAPGVRIQRPVTQGGIGMQGPNQMNLSGNGYAMRVRKYQKAKAGYQF